MLENFKPSDIQPSVESTKDNSLKMPEVKDLPPLGGKENPLKEIKPLPKVEDLPLESKSEVKNELTPLSEESKEELKEQGYPDSVIENIGSEEEKEIYENADLTPKEVNGRDALTKNDIDLKQEDDFGRTNLERMKQGLAPLDKDGNPIELHHVGQKMDSPLAELTRDEHRGKGNDTILHNKQKESEINREDFAKERAEHWKARAEQLESEMNA
nr:HNH/ENDO VII family nuclease [uncultured Haemophilus sp.]